MSVAIKARTALALGVPNLVRALSYRLGVKTGLNPVRRLRGAAPAGPFFAMPACAARPPKPERLLVASQAWQTSARLFSHWPIAVTDEPPDWHSNLLTGKQIARTGAGVVADPGFRPGRRRHQADLGGVALRLGAGLRAARAQGRRRLARTPGALASRLERSAIRPTAGRTGSAARKPRCG
jgi:hypothetical protein